MGSRGRRPESCKFGHPLYAGCWLEDGEYGEHGVVCVAGGGGRGSHGLANRVVLAALREEEGGEKKKTNTNTKKKKKKKKRKEEVHPLLEEIQGAVVVEDGLPCALAVRSRARKPVASPTTTTTSSVSAGAGGGEEQQHNEQEEEELVCVTGARVLLLRVSRETDTGSSGDNGSAGVSLVCDDASGVKIGGKRSSSSTTKTEFKVAVFARGGSLLLLGDVDGTVHVLEWPGAVLVRALKVTGDAAAPPGKPKGEINHISVNEDGSHALVVCESGPMTLWDIERGELLASLPSAELSTDTKRARGRFRSSAFFPGKHGHGVIVSFNDPNGGHLYKYLLPFVASTGDGNGVGAAKEKGGESRGWQKICHAKAQADPITAMALSSSGSLVATGSSEGDVAIFSAVDFSPMKRVKNAHMVFVTGLDFRTPKCTVEDESGEDMPITTSPSGDTGVETLLSISADSAALVTVIDANRKRSAFETICIRLIILLLLLALAFIAYCIHVVSIEIRGRRWNLPFEQ